MLGDVQALENTGGVDITRNTIGGNLQRKSNFPAPTGGVGGAIGLGALLALIAFAFLSRHNARPSMAS